MGAKLIIGLSGKARTGKNSCADAIIAARNGKPYDIKAYSFASFLKDEVRGREAELCAKHGIEPQPNDRWVKLLQFWGTDYRRRMNPFYWINKLKAKLDEDSPTVALVTDVRFKNEAYFCLKDGGYLIRIERLGFTDPTRDPLHKSETDLDDFPFRNHSSKRTSLIQVNDGEALSAQRSAIEVFDQILEELDFSRYFDGVEFTNVDFGVTL